MQWYAAVLAASLPLSVLPTLARAEGGVRLLGQTRGKVFGTVLDRAEFNVVFGGRSVRFLDKDSHTEVGALHLNSTPLAARSTGSFLVVLSTRSLVVIDATVPSAPQMVYEGDLPQGSRASFAMTHCAEDTKLGFQPDCIEVHIPNGSGVEVRKLRIGPEGDWFQDGSPSVTADIPQRSIEPHSPPTNEAPPFPVSPPDGFFLSSPFEPIVYLDMLAERPETMHTVDPPGSGGIVAFDGERTVWECTATEGINVLEFDRVSGFEPIETVEVPGGECHSVEFVARGLDPKAEPPLLFVGGAAEEGVIEYSAKVPREPLERARYNRGRVTYAISATRELLGTADDRTIKLFDLRLDGAVVHEAPSHPALQAWGINAHRYVAGGAGGMARYDAPLPKENPMADFSFDDCLRLHKLDATTLVMTGARRVALVDVSEPSEPRLLSSINSLIFTGGVDAHDGHLFVAHGLPQSLSVWDIRNREAPAFVREFELGARPEDVAISQGVAWVACGDAGIVAVDVTDPGQPSILNAFELPPSKFPRFAIDVSVDGSFVAVAARGGEAFLFDAADPANPILVLQRGSEGGAAALVDGTKFIYGASDQLVALDISSPSAPFRIGFAPLPAPPQHISETGDGTYLVSTGDAGVLEFRIEPVPLGEEVLMTLLGFDSERPGQDVNGDGVIDAADLVLSLFKE